MFEVGDFVRVSALEYEEGHPFEQLDKRWEGEMGWVVHVTEDRFIPYRVKFLAPPEGLFTDENEYMFAEEELEKVDG